MGAVGTESQIKRGEKIFAEVAALCPWSEQWGEENLRQEKTKRKKSSSNLGNYCDFYTA